MAKTKMTLREKKRLVSIGKQLGTLTEADCAYILDPNTTESECQRRMITARKRS